MRSLFKKSSLTSTASGSSGSSHSVRYQFSGYNSDNNNFPSLIQNPNANPLRSRSAIELCYTAERLNSLDDHFLQGNNAVKQPGNGIQYRYIGAYPGDYTPQPRLQLRNEFYRISRRRIVGSAMEEDEKEQELLLQEEELRSHMQGLNHQKIPDQPSKIRSRREIIKNLLNDETQSQRMNQNWNNSSQNHQRSDHRLLKDDHHRNKVHPNYDYPNRLEDRMENKIRNHTQGLEGRRIRSETDLNWRSKFDDELKTRLNDRRKKISNGNNDSAATLTRLTDKRLHKIASYHHLPRVGRHNSSVGDSTTLTLDSTTSSSTSSESKAPPLNSSTSATTRKFQKNKRNHHQKASSRNMTSVKDIFAVQSNPLFDVEDEVPNSAENSEEPEVEVGKGEDPNGSDPGICLHYGSTESEEEAILGGGNDAQRKVSSTGERKVSKVSSTETEERSTMTDDPVQTMKFGDCPDDIIRPEKNAKVHQYIASRGQRECELEIYEHLPATITLDTYSVALGRFRRDHRHHFSMESALNFPDRILVEERNYLKGKIV